MNDLNVPVVLSSFYIFAADTRTGAFDWNQNEFSRIEAGARLQLLLFLGVRCFWHHWCLHTLPYFCCSGHCFLAMKEKNYHNILVWNVQNPWIFRIAFRSFCLCFLQCSQVIEIIHFSGSESQSLYAFTVETISNSGRETHAITLRLLLTRKRLLGIKTIEKYPLNWNVEVL